MKALRKRCDRQHPSVSLRKRALLLDAGRYHRARYISDCSQFGPLNWVTLSKSLTSLFLYCVISCVQCSRTWRLLNETIVPIMLPDHFSHSLGHSHWVGTHPCAQTELHSELCWRAISKLHVKKPDYKDTYVLFLIFSKRGIPFRVSSRKGSSPM